MKAIRLHETGLADKLVYEDVPKPAINDDEVLVKIYAASVNHIDWKKAIGKMGTLPDFPWIPGMDFAGQVERVGDNVEGFNVGDAVMGCSNGGTYAQYIAANPSQMALKPIELSYVDAAAAAFVAQTAWQAVNDHGKVMKGQRVLIRGAAGAVGSYALQFARILGADLYVTASGHDKEYLMGLGADVFIDYMTDDFAKLAQDMDVVIDTVGGEMYGKSYEIIKPGGRLVSLTMPADKKLADRHNITAIYMGVKTNSEDLRSIARMLSLGQLKVDIAAVFWLRDACKAWNYQLGSDAEKVHGKVVLEIE